MSNQQVDDALSDYFTDLLGTTEAVISIEKDKAKHPKIEQIEQDKLESKPIKGLLNSVIGDAVISKGESTKHISSEVAQQQTVKLTEEQTQAIPAYKQDMLLTQKGQMSHLAGKLDDDAIVDKPKGYITKHTLTSSKIEDSLVVLSPLKKSVETQTRLASMQTATKTLTETDTETDSYNDHKSRLERMLRQVSNLTASQDINLKSKVAPQVKTRVQVDLTSIAEVTKSKPAATPQQFAKTSEASDTEPSVNDALKIKVSAEVTPILANQWNENGRPEWAQERFDILLLEVNGLQLAVPLMTLGQIHEIDDEITPLFGQSDWFMGLQKTSDGNVKVVNTAKFIMPERYRDQHNYKYVISIHGLYWGLAVDNIKQPITIDPDAIRWRPKRDSRPWMAGMVKDHMCVLLDIPKIGEILQTQDKNRAD
jgi:purine-binding chemotaxis protein CheW